jgi:hypothetical protein
MPRGQDAGQVVRLSRGSGQDSDKKGRSLGSQQGAVFTEPPGWVLDEILREGLRNPDQGTAPLT